MNKLVWVLTGSMFLVACNDQGAKDAPVTLENDNQKAAYSIGFRTGEQMEGLMEDLDLDSFLSGLRDGATKGSKPAMADDEIETAIQEYQERKIAEAQAEEEKVKSENAAAGDAFRTENGAKEGVTTTESGMQYEVLQAGEEGAASPTLDNTVVVHYHGTLPNGTVFDSSVDRGSPATFPLQGIIKGWQEALPMMKVGDKWRLVLPPELAYGEHGAGGDIGPNQTLVFEVELIEVQGVSSEEG